VNPIGHGATGDVFEHQPGAIDACLDAGIFEVDDVLVRRCVGEAGNEGAFVNEIAGQAVEGELDRADFAYDGLVAGQPDFAKAADAQELFELLAFTMGSSCPARNRGDRGGSNFTTSSAVAILKFSGTVRPVGSSLRFKDCRVASGMDAMICCKGTNSSSARSSPFAFTHS